MWRQLEATLAQAQTSCRHCRSRGGFCRRETTADGADSVRLRAEERREVRARITAMPQDLQVACRRKLVEQRPERPNRPKRQLHAASAYRRQSRAAAAVYGSPQCRNHRQPNRPSVYYAGRFWTAAGNVAQTIFDAGHLLHKKRAPMPRSTQRGNVSQHGHHRLPERRRRAHALASEPTPGRRVGGRARRLKSGKLRVARCSLGASGTSGCSLHRTPIRRRWSRWCRSPATRLRRHGGIVPGLWAAAGGTQRTSLTKRQWESSSFLNEQTQRPASLKVSRPGLEVSEHGLRRWRPALCRTGASEHQLMKLFGGPTHSRPRLHQTEGPAARLEAFGWPRTRGTKKQQKDVQTFSMRMSPVGQ